MSSAARPPPTRGGRVPSFGSDDPSHGLPLLKTAVVYEVPGAGGPASGIAQEGSGGWPMGRPPFSRRHKSLLFKAAHVPVIYAGESWNRGEPRNRDKYTGKSRSWRHSFPIAIPLKRGRPLAWLNAGRPIID